MIRSHQIGRDYCSLNQLYTQAALRRSVRRRLDDRRGAGSPRSPSRFSFHSMIFRLLAHLRKEASSVDSLSLLQHKQ
ncbi:hypothetical protein TNCV_3743221 [Trichonephila clavipes]|nr:hypothetical protein TNCV_3743221 [Trichonephila clavipes]